MPRIFTQQQVFILILLILAPSWAGADLLGKHKTDYASNPDFKAIATAPNQGYGHAWNYDTPEEAARAAVEHCRSSTPSTLCRVVLLGEKNVDADADLPALLKEYETQVIGTLEQRLHVTGKRELLTQLSTIYQKAGQYERSEKLLYDLAMSGEHLAQNALAYHWAELKKQLPKALELAESAIRSDPDFFSYHDTKGLVLARLGRLAEAEVALRHATNLTPNPIALDHLADILWLQGKHDQARKQWARALETSQDILFIHYLEHKIVVGKTSDIVFQ